MLSCLSPPEKKCGQTFPGIIGGGRGKRNGKRSVYFLLIWPREKFCCVENLYVFDKARCTILPCPQNPKAKQDMQCTPRKNRLD